MSSKEGGLQNYSDSSQRPAFAEMYFDSYFS